MLPLNKTTKARRGVTWADINRSPSRPPVAEPDSGQLTVYLQCRRNLGGVKNVPDVDRHQRDCRGRLECDGQPEIFLLSVDERQIGVTQLDEKAGLFSRRYCRWKGVLAMTVGALQAGNKPCLRSFWIKRAARTATRTADGEVRKQKLNESFKSNPSSMTIHDLNQDGLADLVVLIPYEKIKVLLQVAGQDFNEQDVAPPGGSAEQPWLSATDVDGDGKAELLLAQKNFLRAVLLQAEMKDGSAGNKPAWSFSVKEQINGMASNSRIVGAAAVRDGTNNIPALFLLDAERKSLTLCERDNAGVWQVMRNVALPMTEFVSLQATALGETNLNSIAFLGVNAVAWMPFSGQVWEFSELDGYETPIKDGFLHDVVPGDLNQDGRKDLVFLETNKSYLDLVTFEPPHQLVPANRWQVFEERTFRSRRNDIPEPREALVVDLTGDKKNDLAVIVHDRILVYPQE